MVQLITVKFLNFWTPEIVFCNLLKIQTKWPNLVLLIFCQKDKNGIPNSKDPDQTVL